jgi:MOSC domain-containing protein YiiM
MTVGRIASINVSAGGVPKRPVPTARVTRLGLDGDGHADGVHHGGPERALCLYSAERIAALAVEGHPIGPGTIGENVTVEGLPWDVVRPGDRYRLGARVVIEITRFTSPCATIQSSFRDRRYQRVSDRVHPGWSRVYARVLEPGQIGVGDPVVRLGPHRETAGGGGRSAPEAPH